MVCFFWLEENYINNNQFIEELKTKREQYDISQNRLAIACEISRAYLNRIENGKVQVTKKNKKRFWNNSTKQKSLYPF